MRMALLWMIGFVFTASVLADSTSTLIVTHQNHLPQGYTALRVDTLGFCINKLPSESSLLPVSQSESKYLKRILGGSDNRHVTIWHSKITFSYQKKFRLLYVLTPQGGFNTQEPIFREMESTQAITETIHSQTADSDFFAFSSPRQYFFDTESKAKASALKHTQNRLATLNPLMCAPQ